MITFLVILFIVIFIFLFCEYPVIKKRKYTKFVEDNSLALKKLNEINSKYIHLAHSNYDTAYTYDNQIFYNNISCEDFLIYQLQYKKNIVKRLISYINNSKTNYAAYCNEVKQINQFGVFKELISNNLKNLISIEKDLFNKKIYSPITTISIQVTLYCSKINGVIYDEKQQTFNEDQILSIIKRLNNKTGSFYNDREIWDALCRVERGRVSNKMRFAIYERDNYCCKMCGKSEDEEELEIDHIKPIAKGGKSTYDNLQTLCKSCNKKKGNSY